MKEIHGKNGKFGRIQRIWGKTLRENPGNLGENFLGEIHGILGENLGILGEIQGIWGENIGILGEFHGILGKSREFGKKSIEK